MRVTRVDHSVEPHEERSDEVLLRGCCADPAAFAAFYDRYERAVVAYLARRVRDPELVADLTAEVFASALGAAGRYRAAEPTAAGWVFAIAHNALVTSARRRQVEARARLRLGMRDAVSFADDELERVEALANDDGWLQALLARLPVAQREAIRARVLDERSYTEIAAEMTTSELVIRKRVSRGLASLRRELETERRP
ncbi:MAG TPA: RNA polymerase sigma factor [Solirubrobacteraceae bacterium]|nr:RNA polymerase sigma factor [Solirubrobacteraceae bacterium]